MSQKSKTFSTAHNLRLTLVILINILSMNSVFAGKQVYRYNDGGQIIYQDRPPASSQDSGHAVLSRQGVVLKSIPSREERLLLRIEREAARRKEIHDRALLATFSTEDDLVRTRDDRIGMIDGLINRLDDRIRILSDRLSIIDGRINRQEKANGKAYPSLYKERHSILRNVENAWSLIDTKTAERQSLVVKFDTDLDRYRVLKNGKL